MASLTFHDALGGSILSAVNEGNMNRLDLYILRRIKALRQEGFSNTDIVERLKALDSPKKVWELIKVENGPLQTWF